MTITCQTPECKIPAAYHLIETSPGSTQSAFLCSFGMLDEFRDGTYVHRITDACTSAGAIFDHESNTCEVNNVSVFGKEA